MNITIKVTKAFKKQAKPLLKKYKSLASELYQLEVDLCRTPFLGKEISSNIFKIRLAIKSKGKGKSGGARVISYHEFEAETQLVGLIKREDDTQQHTVYLVAIYDKSETDNISDREISDLISKIEIE